MCSLSSFFLGVFGHNSYHPKYSRLFEFIWYRVHSGNDQNPSSGEGCLSTHNIFLSLSERAVWTLYFLTNGGRTWKKWFGRGKKRFSCSVVILSIACRDNSFFPLLFAMANINSKYKRNKYESLALVKPFLSVPSFSLLFLAPFLPYF